ncbi:MAG: PAS domain S-box protein, partial [Deltaproteobacteria bacterium]|nr:PAS domain S-box protein [Deltaproteobacteria bacterium]
MRNPKIKRPLFMLLVLELACLLGLVLGTTYFLKKQAQVSETLNTAIEMHQVTVRLADQLRQSSDDLTRMVRTYAATGDSIFEDHFHAILNIRNGRAPRPEHYDRIFWDFKVAEGATFTEGKGDKVSLRNLMRNAGFTDEEFELMGEAQRRSDELVKMEEIAMNATKGKFRDADGAFTISKEPDQQLALQILFGKEYHLAKNSIMKPINEFLIASDARTAKALETAREKSGSASAMLITLSIGSSVVFLLFAFTGFRYHKVSKARLADSEWRFRNSILNAPYPIMIHAEGDIIELSDVWTKITGYTLDDISTIRKWTNRAYGEDARMSAEFINELYDLEDHHHDGEWEIKTKDGGTRLWDFSTSPVGRLPDGRKAVISMAADITDRKKAEEELDNHRHYLSELVEERTTQLVEAQRRTEAINDELREKEHLLTEAIKIAKMGHASWDEVKREYSSVSEEYAQIFGYNREEFLKNFRTEEQDMGLVHPEDLSSLKYFKQPVKDGKIEYEYRILHRDGSVRHVREIASVALGKENKPLDLISTLQDITDAKQAEVELINAKEAAETANLAKSAFLANMSHEIRTPMNAIVGLTHLIQQSGVTSEQEEKLNKIISSGEHLLSIINDILDISKIEAGKLSLERLDFHIETVFNQVKSLFKEQLAAKDLSLETDLGEVPH